MKLKADPKVVASLAAEREDANWRFRSFLKSVDLESGKLDARVQRHYEEASSQIDCCACGNCCRELLPTLTDDDVSRLAAGLRMSREEILTEYLTREENGELTFNERPCPFLEENRCRVYEHRPETCRSYPHLHKEQFVSRLTQAVKNCAICPIVFNVYERLKAELWRRPDDS